MTKAEALFKFWNGFGITAMPTTAVTNDMIFPWIAYEAVIGNQGDQVATTVNIWYHTDSEAIPNAKADEIAEAIGLGGKQIPYTEGSILIRMGNPWCTPLTDSQDSSIKRRMLNISYDYL